MQNQITWPIYAAGGGCAR